MARKPTVAVWVNPDQAEQVERIASSERRSSAAVLRIMLEDYMAGTLIPAKEDKKKETRKMLSATVEPEFKELLEKKMADDGLSIATLVDLLLVAKQGDKK